MLDEVEDRYARQLRRRRAALLGSLADWLWQAKADPQPLPDEWALAAQAPGAARAVFLVTPRAPTPADLRRLDGLRRGLPSRRPRGRRPLGLRNAGTGRGRSRVGRMDHRSPAAVHPPARPRARLARPLMIDLDGARVFLSASFPSGTRGERFKPYDAVAVAEAVTALAQAVIVGGGRLVFGAHPTISPLVLLVAGELNRPGIVAIHQSRHFEGRVPQETLDLVTAATGCCGGPMPIRGAIRQPACCACARRCSTASRWRPVCLSAVWRALWRSTRCWPSCNRRSHGSHCEHRAAPLRPRGQRAPGGHEAG